MTYTILIVFLVSSFLISYLLGSLNFAIIVTKLFGKGDIRDYGSGNAGMTNVLRTVGKKAAALTLLGDFLKGFISLTAVRVLYNIFFATYAASNVFYSTDEFVFVLAQYIAFYGSFLGHLFPIYYKFKGGKGVVVSFGAVMVLSPLTGLACVVSLITTVLTTRYMSLGSMICAVILPIGIGINNIGKEQQLAQILFVLPVTIGVIYMHRENIKRLINKTENKVSLGKKKEEKEVETMAYKLETERLTLRQLSMDDAEHIFKSWTSNEEVTQYLIYDCHQTIDDTKEWLGFVESDNNSTSDTRGYDFGFELKSTGELIGSGGFSYSSKHQCLEIGYNIMQSEWRKGYTLEACKQLLDFAKNELKVKKVVAKHAMDNSASENLLEKLGFKFTEESTFSSFSGKKQFKSKEYELLF